ncbi:MAG: FtsX-like permease family protein, partial [Planctomycetaceae bacterium]
LALVGGACGVLMAMWLDRLICVVMATISSVRIVPGLNARILLFGLAVSCMSGVLFGLAPALRTMLGVTPALRLRANHDSPLRAAHWNVHGLLVVVQMACSMAVLVCGGLCLFSLIKVRWMDPGFDPARILAVSVDSRQTLGSPLKFLEDLQQRVAQLPHVESVSLAGQIPLAEGGGYTSGVKRMEGRDISAGEEIIVDHAFVSPGYFRTLGLPLLKGRDIAAADVPGSARVMVINEIMAQRCWPGQDPIGKHVTFPAPEPQGEQVIEVVGVVKAAKHEYIREELKPVVYRPLAQVPEDRPVLLVRVAHNPKTVADSVRKMAMSLDVSTSACDARTIAQRQSRLFHPQRVLTGIVGTFGLVVLVLSATGIYGVTAYAVRQRTREIGIRIAMGAQRHDILVLVLLKGAALTMAGLVLGTGLSLIAMRLLESSLPGLHAWNPDFLLGVTSSDPLPYVCAALVLTLAAFVACFLPARRAAKIDPMTALRCE